MRKIFYSLCIFLGVISTAIILHKFINIYAYHRQFKAKIEFAENLFNKDNSELLIYKHSSEKVFDLSMQNSKIAIKDFLLASQKIEAEEISKEELRSLLDVYKNSIFKGENNVGVKKLYFNFLDKLSVNKNAFVLEFVKKFGDEKFVSENANALSVNMDFYLFDFYNSASYEVQMQVIASAFINSMNEILKDKGVKFFVKSKDLITQEDKIYNCIDCEVLASQKKSEIQKFASSLGNATEISLQKSKLAFSFDVENNLSLKLFKLHKKAYKKIIGIYLK